jgi:hypothetical protein
MSTVLKFPAKGTALRTIDRCTLTGADDKNDIKELLSLGEHFSFVELGILYSRDRVCSARYPTVGWIRKLVEENQKDPKVDLALHVCGKATMLELLYGAGEFPTLLNGFKRVQLNFRYTDFDMNNVTDFVESMAKRGIKVIFQHNHANRNLYKLMAYYIHHVDFLLDSSGGRGVMPETWQEPIWPRFGYAGGLGPDNIKKTIDEVKQYIGPGQSLWFDMESKLRNEETDTFDLEKCQTVLKAFTNN